MPGNDWSEFEHPPTDRLIADHQSVRAQSLTQKVVALALVA